MATHKARIGVLAALEKPLHPDPTYLDANNASADKGAISERHRERVVKYINEVRGRRARARGRARRGAHRASTLHLLSLRFLLLAMQPLTAAMPCN